MKPIEYRGIDLKTNAWVYGYYALIHDGQGNDVDCIFFPGTEEGIPIIPETLGVKVEEGVYTGDKFWSPSADEDFTVVFNEDTFSAGYQFESTLEDGWEGLSYDDIRLGTIHDHLLGMNPPNRETIIERIVHLITSGLIDEETFEFYFSDTKIGYMNYEELLLFLKGDNNK